jgi:hypothetical protein
MTTMLKSLKLRQKFTILLILILVFGLGLSGFSLSSLLKQNAKQEIANNALSLIETISALREYTVSQVTPELLDKLETKFLPQTVSAYSAKEVFEILRKKPEYKEFFYKEAALNPTNLRDKADTFESDIIKRFIDEKDLKELSGFRSLPGGDIFYIARPLKLTQQGLLEVSQYS